MNCIPLSQRHCLQFQRFYKFIYTREPLPPTGDTDIVCAVISFMHLEKHVEAAFKQFPNNPAILHHYWVALKFMGNEDEAAAILRDICSRFPDYLTTQTAMVILLAEEKELTKARAILERLRTRKQLYLSEFRSLASAEMAVLTNGPNTKSD